MKIATWNLNSFKVREAHLDLFIEKHQPDVVCLQELKMETHRFPKDKYEQQGFHVVVLGQKTYNGVAVLSRTPLEDMGSAHHVLNALHQRYIGVRTRGVQIHCIYAPNGQEVGCDKYQFKLDWYQQLAGLLKETPGEKILCGDFNIAPTAADVYDPEAWEGKILCSEAERVCFQQLVQAGLFDLPPAEDTTKPLYTWWDYRGGLFYKNHGLRIDLILGTDAIREKCRSVKVDRTFRAMERPSDHAPVVMEFEWEQRH